MRRAPLLIVTAAFLALAVDASAMTIWDESIDGDLSTVGALPTPVAFSPGSNVIIGSIQSPGDTRDFITFTIAPGQGLASLTLLSWSTDIGYHAINVGGSSQDPDFENTAFFLAGNHVQTEGADLLPGLSTGGIISGPGFALPLGPGTYSYLIQQTGTELIEYSLDFELVPEPSPAALLGAALTLGALVRRRGWPVRPPAVVS